MPSPLLVKASAGREICDVTPERAGWQHVGFRALRLAAGELETLATGALELCLVVLTGTVRVSAQPDGEGPAAEWFGLGQRDSVFDNLPPAAVYVPPGHQLSITAERDAEVALCTAPGHGQQHPLRAIDPATMRRSVRGQGANTRHVCDILPHDDPQAASLLVVEVITPAGHSSSYPPHKHDQQTPPTETLLEETYYHRLNPPQGFAFQRVYTDDRSLDEACAVEDHDVVMVPRGYHPVVAPHGYDLYYLNVMAGPQRLWVFKNDPQHEWMLHNPPAPLKR
ncbi:5-deoxy-glucuronate isomerase [Ideonella livida]|uniref:5-deoxy-glucuronate isomerase n=1 Tax=Ideonella livida TaxID=2707176 RepID=A0A7C9PIN7_9BURK|nr:5-deoxy-glucuronate isomerase [Ideonella livida]NDY92010.1 5-deoxy-glucuronate isomerase [Ideonella livida]